MWEAIYTLVTIVPVPTMVYTHDLTPIDNKCSMGIECMFDLSYLIWEIVPFMYGVKIDLEKGW